MSKFLCLISLYLLVCVENWNYWYTGPCIFCGTSTQAQSSWVGSSPLIEACTPVVTLIKRRWMPFHTAADSGSFKLFIQESASLHKLAIFWGNVMLNGISTARQEWASFRQCLYSWWRDGAMIVFVQSVKRQPHFQSCLPCLKFTLVSGLNWSNCNGNHFHLLGQNLVLLSCGCTVETLNERLPSQEATLPLNHTAWTPVPSSVWVHSSCQIPPPPAFPFKDHFFYGLRVVLHQVALHCTNTEKCTWSNKDLGGGGVGIWIPLTKDCSLTR